MPICIPFAHGVPGRPLPPNWWDPSPASPLGSIDTRLEDPRWRGAFSQTFGQGIAQETAFRALFHRTASGDNFLYLSWHVLFDQSFNVNQDKIFLAISASGVAQPTILQVVIFADNMPKVAAPAASIVAGTRDALGHFQQFDDEPDWIAETARVWVDPSAPVKWALQLRIPIKTGAPIGNDGGVDINPASPFRMWYCYDIYTSNFPDGSPAEGGILRLPWPITAGLTFSGGYVYPASSAFEEYQLGGTGVPSCTGGVGVSLNWLNVGTMNVPASEINRFGPNVFFARPTNVTSAPIVANQLRARFALANWGSVADPAAPWTELRRNVGNAAAIPVGATANVTSQMSFSWPDPANPADQDFLDQINSGAKSRHQCMFVQLTGAGLTFLNDSVYRNMDFVPASKFTRDAEISVVGLTPFSLYPRDVYLAVETLHLEPSGGETVNGGEGNDTVIGVAGGGEGSPPPRVAAFGLAARAAARLPTLADITEYVNSFDYNEQSQTPAELEAELRANLPTYCVHCYYDTGRRERIDGRTYSILSLQSGFGYHVVHETIPDQGWRHSLTGAIRISENFYLLRVPNNGTATVTTTIQALEAGEIPESEPPIITSIPSVSRIPYITTWLVLGPIFDANHQSGSVGNVYPNAGDIVGDIEHHATQLDPNIITGDIGHAPAAGDIIQYGEGIFKNRSYIWQKRYFTGLDWESISDIADDIHSHLPGDVQSDPFDVRNYLNFSGKHHALAFFLIYIISPDERTTLLGLRHDDALRVWLNGAEIIQDSTLPFMHDHDIIDERETCIEVTLHQGTNILLAAVAETNVEWGFSARIEAYEGLRITADNPNRDPMEAGESGYDLVTIAGSGNLWNPVDLNRALAIEGRRTWRGRVRLNAEPFKIVGHRPNWLPDWWGPRGRDIFLDNFTNDVPGVYDVVFFEDDPTHPVLILVKPFAA